MSLQVLGHPERLDFLLSENGLQHLVGGEELPVLGVLELVLFQVGPQSLHNLVREKIKKKYKQSRDRVPNFWRPVAYPLPSEPKLFSRCMIKWSHLCPAYFLSFHGSQNGSQVIGETQWLGEASLLLGGCFELVRHGTS